MSAYYYYNGQKINLTAAATKRAFQVNTPHSVASEIDKARAAESSFHGAIHLGGGIVAFDAAENVTAKHILEASAVGGKPLLVFDTGNNTHVIVTREFVCKFKPGVSQEQIDAFNRENAVTVVGRQQWDTSILVLAVPEGQEAKTLDMANKYFESNLVEFAHPNFRRMMRPSVLPNDPLFSAQWALQNTGQAGGVAGQDIHVLPAWNHTIGSPAITIAIIDEGVDYTHEDFQAQGKLVLGYDAVGANGNNPAPNPGDAHGTCCAGIATALGNNGRGICGVAPGCRLMGVRIAQNQNGAWDTTDTQIANGIGFAFQHGADVLNNSWGGLASDLITRVLVAAKNAGRGGKGAILCCAAGNENQSVQFPANLPECFAVAACNQYGEAKTLGSQDGAGWGTNFGPEVKVTAPGISIMTTDMMGDLGYNHNGNYYPSFDGTSAATPHVAGVAALVLSINPALSAVQVEQILAGTAESISPPAPNPYTGYGRVNAAAAVAAAIQTLPAPAALVAAVPAAASAVPVPING